MNREVTGLRYLRVWQAVGAILIVAAFIASLGPYPIRSSIHNLDKLFHAATYAGLAFWFMQLNVRRRYFWVAIGLVAMGILIEYLQTYTRTRLADVYDALANTLGVAVGWGMTLTPAGRLLAMVDRWLGRGLDSSQE